MTNITALNTASGQVGIVPAVYLEIPGLKEYLVEVPDDTKSYDPEKYRPVTAEEYIASHKKGSKTTLSVENDKLIDGNIPE